MAIWRAASSVRVCKCAHSDCAWEQGPQQVASSASITATPVTVYLSASCGLWACAQQSRLTVIPSGMTNYLCCLILACNSWMWTAALIRKNFHQQATHLCYEIWQAFSRHSILSFTFFQPSFFLAAKKIQLVPKSMQFTFYILTHFSCWPFSAKRILKTICFNSGKWDIQVKIQAYKCSTPGLCCWEYTLGLQENAGMKLKPSQ